MSAEDIDLITIVGAGSMGHGIAEVAALHGFDVRIRDIEQEILDEAMEKIEWSLDKLVDKDQVPRDQADAALERISTTTDLEEAVQGTDFVIEAVPEDLDLKQDIFQDLEAATEDDVVLASNTSTIRITEIAKKVDDPSRVVGMHFFNPVIRMDLVEIIRGEDTADRAVDATSDLAEAMGKTVVVCHKDLPGFITSRLVGAFFNTAASALERGVATKEEIDAALKFDAGFPMGPFELVDMTGIDIAYHTGSYVASRLGDEYAPPSIIEEKAESGDHGQKTGKGFYDYEDGDGPEVRPEQSDAFDENIVLSAVANEAAKLFEKGAGSPSEIDQAMRLGAAFPEGPLEWADGVGLDVVEETLEDLHEETGKSILEPAPAIRERVESGRTGEAAGEGFYTYDDGEETASYETLQVEVDPEDHVATVTLDRPHRMNSISATLGEELQDALLDLDEDDDVRAVLLTGAGDDAFSVGADLQETGGIPPHEAQQLSRNLFRVTQQIEDMGKIVVAGFNGRALGGGLELGLACDFRVAAKRATVGQPEINLGLIPGAGGTQRLPKLIGLSKAKEMVLLGDDYPAEEAADFGLIHRVYDNDGFDERAREFTAEIAEGPPIAQRVAKGALNAAPDTDLSNGREIEANGFGLLLSTEDVMEGVAAMFGDHEPEFEGK
jgi:enoyl-CoA hydratase/3-hydroxyacyl-CoA dehydrogenase